MISSIGKENYGLYTLAMSVISLFVFDFGLGSAVSRFVSKYLSEGRQDKVNNLLGLVFKLYLAIDVFILVFLSVLYFFIPSIYQGLTTSELNDFKIVYLIAAVFCVFSFPFTTLNGILVSYEKFVQLKSCDLAHKIIVVTLMTICLLLGGGLFSLVLVNSIAGLVVIILKLCVLGRVRIQEVSIKFWDIRLLRTVFEFSAWVMVIQLSQRCIFNLAPSLLAAFSNSESVSILGIAIVLEGYTYTFANAINGMFLPKVSRMLATNDRDSIVKLMIRVGRIQIYIIGLICMGFICIGKDFILAWVGQDYFEVYPCALMIILPSLFHLPQEIGSTTIVAEGKVKHQAYAFLIMAAVNLLLALPLSKLYGVKGLCFSIMLSYLLRTLLMDYLFYKELKLDVISFFKESFLKILPIIFLSAIASFGLCRCIPVRGWSGVIIKGLICVIIFVAFIWPMAMNGNERDLIINPLKRMLSPRKQENN